MQPRLVPEGSGGGSNGADSSSSSIRPIGEGRAGKAAADGSYEKSIIGALCEAGGLKAVPAPDKLKQFLADSSTLNPDLIGCCLLDQMNEDAWQARSKALQVVSALAESPNCAAHRKWWADDAETLDDLRSLAGKDPKAKVRTSAVGALKALGVPTEDLVSFTGGGKAAGGGTGGTGDLLDGFGDDSNTAATDNAALADIFGGGALAPASTAAAAGILDMFDSMPPVGTTAGGAVGVIDTSQAPLNAPPQAPANSAATMQSNNDMFAGMSMGSAAAVSAAGGTDLLGNDLSPLTSGSSAGDIAAGAGTGTESGAASFQSDAAISSSYQAASGASSFVNNSDNNSSSNNTASPTANSGFGFMSKAAAPTPTVAQDNAPMADLLGGDFASAPAPAQAAQQQQPADLMMGMGMAANPAQQQGVFGNGGMMSISGQQQQQSNHAGMNMGGAMGMAPTLVGTDMGSSDNMNTMRSFQGMQTTDPSLIAQRKQQQEAVQQQQKKKVTDLMGSGFQM
jgi:hypothetical protein